MLYDNLFKQKLIKQLNTKVIELQDQLKIKEIQLQDKLKINEKLQFENKVLKEKLASKSYKEDEFLKLVGDLHMDLRQRESSLKELLESYPTPLTIKDSESNEMLQNGLKELTEVCVFHYVVFSIGGNLLNQVHFYNSF